MIAASSLFEQILIYKIFVVWILIFKIALDTKLRRLCQGEILNKLLQRQPLKIKLILRNSWLNENFQSCQQLFDIQFSSGMSPLSFFDRVKCSRTLESPTASVCGIIGSLACIAVSVWMYIFLVFAYRDKKYQETYYETQFAGTESLITPTDIKLVMVFLNKSSNAVANHTQLRIFMKPRVYQSNQNGVEVNFQPADYCDSDYFSDAVNPFVLQDCFLFPPNRMLEFSYNPSASISASTIGFQFTYNCLNPFTCRSGGSALISVQNNLLGLFTNYSANLYFSVQRLQQNGSVRHQVFQISSGQFTNSIGVAASINAQLNINRVRIDQSVMPWNSIAKYNLLEYSGLVKGTTKSSTAVYTPLPTYNIVSSNFQTIIFKYGLKLDWLIGIIGGGVFLNYIICFFICFPYNQSLSRSRHAEQLILVAQIKQQSQLPELSKPQVSKWYFLQRFSPFYEDKAMKEILQKLDITKIIKKQKLTFRNLKRYMNKNDLKIEDPQTIVDYREITNQFNGQRIEAVYLNVEINEEYIQRRKKKSQLLGIHPQGLKALQSQNAPRIFSQSPSALHYRQQVSEFKQIQFIQSFQDDPIQKQPSYTSRLLNFLKKFDLYSAPISFDIYSYSSTFLGIILTLVIIIAPILLLSSRVSTDSFQLHNSEQVMEGNQINYILKTGIGFRPAVCFSQSAVNNYLVGSNKKVNINFFTYSYQQGYTSVGANKLQAGMTDFLGISSDSSYTNIDTSLCFVMPDGIEVPMRGMATGDQAFFGYQLKGYCSGTQIFCDTQINQTNSNITNFIADSSNTIILYLPLNQYDEAKQTVLSGNVYANPMREGVSGFNFANSIEQTVYVDRIQLLDGKSRQFVGKQPKVIQDTIFSSRYSLNENTKEILNSTNLFYEARIRPSDRITKAYMIGLPTENILGYIGGSFYIACVLAYFGRKYSAFVTKARMAYYLYNDEIINKVSIFHQILYLIPFFPLRIFCCGNCAYSTRRMREMQSKLKRETNLLKVVRIVDICEKLVASLTNNKDIVQLSRVFLKQKLSKSEQISLYHKSQKEQKFDDHDDDQEILANNKNKVANTQTEKQHSINPKQQQEDDQDQIGLKQHQQEIFKSLKNNNKQKQAQQKDRNIIKPEQPYQFKVPSHCLGNGSPFDFFQASAQLSFKNQWRMSSIFGFILTIISIIFVFLIFSSYKGNYNQPKISSTKGIPAKLSQIPPLQLNYSNFRVALGFITKPSFAFKNVSSFITDSNTSLLGASVIQYSQVWVNSTLVINETRYNLTACPQKYFDNFYSQNQDKEYISSYTNGFCLPPNISLLLAPERQNNSYYFRFTIYPYSASGNTVLNNLMTTNVLGMYMTVPKIDQKKKKIYYSVQQIKPNTETLTRAYDVNITLTKQKVIYTSPNYTINQNSSVIETYNYLENRDYERINKDTPTANPKVSNITFSYSGLQEVYEESYPHFAQAYGILGGIIIVVFFTGGLIGRSFNNYKKNFQIGLQLYIPHNSDASSYNQLDIFAAWLLSFIAIYTKDYRFNKKLFNIHSIIQKAKIDLNFFQFLRKLQEIKYIINQLGFNLINNPKISLYNIPSKAIIFSDSKKKHRRQVSPNDIHYDKKQALHNLTSRDAFRVDYCQQQNELHFIDLIQSEDLRYIYKLSKEAKRTKNLNRSIQQPLKKVKKIKEEIQYLSIQQIIQPQIHYEENQIQRPQIQNENELINIDYRQLIQLDSRNNMAQLNDEEHEDINSQRNPRVKLINVQDFGGGELDQ